MNYLKKYITKDDIGYYTCWDVRGDPIGTYETYDECVEHLMHVINEAFAKDNRIQTK